MNKFLFVGVDVSKKTLDWAFSEMSRQKIGDSHLKVENSRKGISKAMRWLKGKGYRKADIWVCMEHTGVYSELMCEEMEDNGVRYSIAGSLSIKNSLGLIRGKDDKIDAYRISWYLAMNYESIEPSKLPPEVLRRITKLTAERQTYVRDMVGAKARMKTLGRCDSAMAKARLERKISQCESFIADIEREISELIKSDGAISENYKLLCTVPCIGFVNAVETIVNTVNFTAFDNVRKYACYIGIAPFRYESGTSVRGHTGVSKMGCTMAKSYLSQAAVSAISMRHSMLRAIYERRIAAGKAVGSALNVIKFKLASYMFSVIRNQKAFVPLPCYK
jgi:transposase